VSLHALMPGMTLPIVPGHEVIGTVVAVGSDVTRFKVGEVVGRGWHGGHCHQCDYCVKGNFKGCEKLTASGVHTDGGYGEYMVGTWSSFAKIPEGMKAEEAAPLLCAGLTVYNGLRHSGAVSGDVVAIQGIGGLGHYGVQFARAMGFRTVAISSGADKRELAKALGAHHYIDDSKENTVAELKKLGGARVILTTVTDSKNMSKVFDGLRVDGALVVAGADVKPIEVSPVQLINGARRVLGVYAGTPADAEDALNFAKLAGVKPYVEVYPFEKTSDAFDRMLSNKQRFRVVISYAKKA